uniref:Uncharacterized protein n=1 Tax=Siphoviridae sp. ctTnV63 TaxID=2825523 RepID=A0A8S5NXE2_9CAUD|nr:MAG TPA: hypothetical protein [Siphoviridae sp. ctTnV63]
MMSIIWLNDLYRDLDRERNIIDLNSNFCDERIWPKERGLRAKLKLVETDMIDQKMVQQLLDELGNQKKDKENVSTE